MVSAVFHSPDDANTEPLTVSIATPLPLARDAANEPVAKPVPVRPPRAGIDWRAVCMRVLPPVCGLGLHWLVWTGAKMKGG